jgi:CheY-like chemotaxis protein
VVDDIEVNQELARIILEADGHRVDVASGGGEALNLMQSRDYDLILMDIQMPGVDGITATRELRMRSSRNSQIPVIAMTANVLPQQVQQFKEAGMNDHIGKPMSRSEISSVIYKWLSSNDRLRILNGSISEQNEAKTTVSFDKVEYTEFKNMMGVERTHVWMARLDENLRDVFENDGNVDPEILASKVHALIPQISLIGFSELAKICGPLEQACKEGIGYMELLSKSRDLAQFAISTIERLTAEITTELKARNM